MRLGIDPRKVFRDADWALLIGAKPRGPGMERRDLLDLNGQIYKEQGQALNEVASRNCKMLVVGNPCNTNALIGLENAPDLPRRNWHALTRLDENRAKVCAHHHQYGRVMSSSHCAKERKSTWRLPELLNGVLEVGYLECSPPRSSLLDPQSSIALCKTPQCQLALKAGKFYTSVTNMCIWGNHSTTQVPDFVNAKIEGVARIEVTGKAVC